MLRLFARGGAMALPTFWKDHIEAWQASGLTQAAYCRQQRLNAGTFSGRLREYRASPAAVEAPGLIPIRLEPEVASSSALSAPLILRLASGHCLELSASVDPRWLAELLRCLG
jgi:hypothetical protein